MRNGASHTTRTNNPEIDVEPEKAPEGLAVLRKKSKAGHVMLLDRNHAARPPSPKRRGSGRRTDPWIAEQNGAQR